MKLKEIPHPDEEILDKIINIMCESIIEVHTPHKSFPSEYIYRKRLEAYKSIENNTDIQALIKKRMNLPKR